jgi:hypothetical protein
MAATDAGRTPPAPTGIVGLLIWFICFNNRKKEIGGWLLYYYIQLYIGVVITLVLALVSFHNYLPTAWAAQPNLYPLFLLSTVPGVVVVPVQLVLAERLRLSRDYRHVHTLRVVLWADLAAAIVGTVIDARFFEQNLGFDILALIWPCIWLPYFYVSKRVVRVFRTKDWVSPAPPAPTA